MVVIEIIGGEGKTPRFERPTQTIIRVGRALDNDIIIDDPWIDPHHMVLDVSDAENWHAADLNSENGTFKARNAIRNVSVLSGDELLLGKTRIRIFRQDHRVPPARSLRDLEHWLLSFDSIPMMIGLMFALAILPCVVLYLNLGGNDIKLNEYIFASTSLLGSSLLIGGFWSLIARLLRGEARFRVLLNITMISGLVSALVRPVISIISYNFPGAGVEQITNLLLSVLFMSVYVYVVLLLSTRLTSRLSQIVAVILATGTIGTYAATQYSVRSEFHMYPHYDGDVHAPTFLLRRGDTPAEFRARLPDVFARADKLAVEASADE
ncbi:MAG TPA: FHA domain-containing protein [Pseudomonadales bacterium]|nr:FHA domain-containing protein [Pseudomonadales bacterium]